MYKNSSAKVEGTTDNLIAKLYGGSTLKASGLQSNNVILINEDSSTAEIRALNTFDLSSKGSAKTKLYGDSKITISEFLDTSKLEKEKN
jgi:hypothetical protein